METAKNKYILKVRDKEDLEEIRDISNITFISEILNIVGIELHDDSYKCKLDKIDNVIEYRESAIGKLLHKK